MCVVDYCLVRSIHRDLPDVCVPEVVWHYPFACGANRLLLHPSSCMNSSTYARCNQRLLSPWNIHGLGSDRVGPHKSPLPVSSKISRNFQISLGQSFCKWNSGVILNTDDAGLLLAATHAWAHKRVRHCVVRGLLAWCFDLLHFAGAWARAKKLGCVQSLACKAVAVFTFVALSLSSHCCDLLTPTGTRAAGGCPGACARHETLLSRHS